MVSTEEKLHVFNGTNIDKGTPLLCFNVFDYFRTEDTDEEIKARLMRMLAPRILECCKYRRRHEGFSDLASLQTTVIDRREND